MAELKPEALTALVDSREQQGYDLAPMKMEVVGLATGDYSILGLSDLVTLERKSLPDFIACCAPERRRFKAELHRMMSYKYRSVVPDVQSPPAGVGVFRFVFQDAESHRHRQIGNRRPLFGHQARGLSTPRPTTQARGPQHRYGSRKTAESVGHRKVLERRGTPLHLS